MKGKLKGFKINLPKKNCIECKRLFQYRKKWKKSWDEIKYCSQKCRVKSKQK